ncbi:MAG TPA: hypothetical protein PLW02_01060, partial [Verrucomicrobiota bacterium]|nr:hypothetical protein [Verrucomicrobiota bacterium]
MENKNQPRKGKGYASIVLTIIVIGLFVAGVVGAYVYIASSPTWYVKWKIQSYLRKQTGKSNFQTDFQFPSEKEMKTVPDALKTNVQQVSQVGKVTKKDIKSLRAEVNRLASSNKVLRAEISNLQASLDAKKADLAKIQVTTNADPVVISNLNGLKLTITNLVSALSSKREQFTAINKELNTYSQDLQELQKEINSQQQAIQSA